jgi:hypothetical protein
MSNERSAGAVGLTVFASIMMLAIGIFQVIMGITAIAKDNVAIFARTEDASYVFSINTTGWGWIHLIIGVVVFLAGLGVLAGQVWARTIGVIIALASAILNFMFIPIYPLWAIVIITLDVFVIWALTAHGRDITE